MKHVWEKHPMFPCDYCVRCNLVYKKERENGHCDPRDVYKEGAMDTPPGFGYGRTMKPIEVELLLYNEIVADTYHIIDALKNEPQTNHKPRSEWLHDLEKLLKRLGHARPNLTSPRIMRGRKAR